MTRAPHALPDVEDSVAGKKSEKFTTRALILGMRLLY